LNGRHERIDERHYPEHAIAELGTEDYSLAMHRIETANGIPDWHQSLLMPSRGIGDSDANNDT
jgi:hypothetical protein